ncbi:hypothetical protein HDV04_003555 [Boothiomyces sp. JEL0838]|nr:hypothetical protein HDV04_003555 [Boothiomyces sp. JEL0838]
MKTVRMPKRHLFEIPDTAQNILLQKYNLERVLGQGVSGTVYKSVRISDNLPTAIKIIPKNSGTIYRWKYDRSLGTTVPMEVFILKRLDFPGIVKFIEFLEDLNYFYLVMEFVGSENKRRSSFDLFDLISNSNFIETRIKHIFKQVAESVSYLHEKEIIHGDIKDENIVIDSDFNAKLVDFGSSDTGSIVGFRGTKHYTPPELVNDPNYKHDGFSVDVWCLGVLLYTLSFSTIPFKSMQDIIEGKYQETEINRSKELMDLLSKMLELDPKKRITIAQVQSHPWLL